MTHLMEKPKNEKAIIHYPNLKTVLLVEETINIITTSFDYIFPIA